MPDQWEIGVACGVRVDDTSNRKVRKKMANRREDKRERRGRECAGWKLCKGRIDVILDGKVQNRNW